jgi:hypothetical protein
MQQEGQPDEAVELGRFGCLCHRNRRNGAFSRNCAVTRFVAESVVGSLLVAAGYLAAEFLVAGVVL